MGIWLKDGTFEPLFGDERNAMADLIHKKLGFEAERKFLELCPYTYEDIVDAYDEGYQDGYSQGRGDAQ